MTSEVLKANVSQMKEIIRELYIFTNQLAKIKNLEMTSQSNISTKEKKLLEDSIIALTNQLVILNDSLPGLLKLIKFYKELGVQGGEGVVVAEGVGGVAGVAKSVLEKKSNYVQIKYKPEKEKKEVQLAIDNKFKEKFLANLSKSNLSINQLKKKYSTKKAPREFGRSNFYARISNRFFRKYSNQLVAAGYFVGLNRNLRKINSIIILGTYVSMALFTMLWVFIVGIFLFITLLFFNLSLTFPMISVTEQGVWLRALKFFWVIFASPIFAGLLMYLYPATEAKSIAYRIDQELPFITIHMSAVASSGIEPMNIFKILLKSSEYNYTNKHFRKIMNLINFHGLDLVTALKQASKSSPSIKLRELLGGMATSITSGGSLHHYLDKRAERLLFDYKLEREKYTKASETFMNIYISVVIAAPMIFLMLFLIIGGTGMLTSFIGLSINALSLLIVMLIVLLNIGFLVFLKIKQPAI